MTDKYCIHYSLAAKDDLKSIYSYIAFNLKEKQTAINQINRIRKSIKSLDTFPERYVKVDWEPWVSMEMHKLPVDNYVIYYLVDKEKHIVTIVRIFYGGQNVECMINS